MSAAKPLRAKIQELDDWDQVKNLYRGVHFNTPPFERVEAYGVSEHALHQKLPNLQKFWRFHIAPATNRGQDTHLAANVGQVTSRMAERSYEIYANLCDALDELKTIKNGQAKAPRYRACLNVLRYVGDTFHLFDELVDVIGTRNSKQPQHKGARPNLATTLHANIRLFPDWYVNWKSERDEAIAYRNMLVHHGRPWYHFDRDEFVGTPFVLDAKHCAYAGSRSDLREFLTWGEQRDLFNDPQQRNRFISLSEACARSCDNTIRWLNRGYGRINARLDHVLAAPSKFAI